jgi:hypothetical protein
MIHDPVPGTERRAAGGSCPHTTYMSNHGLVGMKERQT